MRKKDDSKAFRNNNPRRNNKREKEKSTRDYQRRSSWNEGIVYREFYLQTKYYAAVSSGTRNSVIFWQAESTLWIIDNDDSRSCPTIWTVRLHECDNKRKNKIWDRQGKRIDTKEYASDHFITTKRIIIVVRIICLNYSNFTRASCT